MAKVELGCDWRARPPEVLAIGPVLHPDDAVANKVTTLFGRAAPRDYLDVNAALASGRYSGGRCCSWRRSTTPGSIRDTSPKRCGRSTVGRTGSTRHTASTAARWRTCADGCAPGLPRSLTNGSTRNDPASCVDPSTRRRGRLRRLRRAPELKATVTEPSDGALVDARQRPPFVSPAWSTASLGAQLQFRWCAADAPFGGQPVDGRLWTVHHGVAQVNQPHVL